MKTVDPLTSQMSNGRRWRKERVFQKKKRGLFLSRLDVTLSSMLVVVVTHSSPVRVSILNSPNGGWLVREVGLRRRKNSCCPEECHWIALSTRSIIFAPFVPRKKIKEIFRDPSGMVTRLRNAVKTPLSLCPIHDRPRLISLQHTGCGRVVHLAVLLFVVESKTEKRGNSARLYRMS